MRMLGANKRDAREVLHCITWNVGQRWSLLEPLPSDMSSIPLESARRYVAMIDALASKPGGPEDLAAHYARYLFGINEPQVQALRERAQEIQSREIKSLAELAAEKLAASDVDAAKTFLNGTLTLTSDAAARILEQAAGRVPRRVNAFITSLRNARAKAFEEHHSRQRQAAKSHSMGLSP